MVDIKVNNIHFLFLKFMTLLVAHILGTVATKIAKMHPSALLCLSVHM
jgi:hypothetical protein